MSGADPIDTRPGFAELLDRIEGNGVRTVIVEDASRFARELMTQELGILALIRRGVRVLTANGDDLTDSSDPSRKMMRQIAGAFHEYEKARLVAKLKAARDRKRAAVGKCEGRKSWAEINPELVREAKRLRRRSPKGHQRSLRDVAAELAKLGFVNERGAPVLGVLDRLHARRTVRFAGYANRWLAARWIPSSAPWHPPRSRGRARQPLRQNFHRWKFGTPAALSIIPCR